MTIQPSNLTNRVSGTSAPAGLAKKGVAPVASQSVETASTPQESVSISKSPSPAPTPKASAQSAPKTEAEAAPPEAGTVKVSVYQQDPFVAKPILMEIPANEIGNNFSSPRVVTQDNRPLAKPDAQGNYLLAEGSDGISQATAHVITNQTLQLFEKYEGGKIDWAVGKQMTVTPHKQEGRNAYYSRWGGGTNYFFSDSPGLGRVMKTANSADVVSHETGHALLDGLRPGYFGTHDDETGAFHEAFGDCAAILYGLSKPENRELFLQQTGGDMRKHNVFSSLAEEFGAARVLDNTDPSDDHKTWLRTTLADFTYAPPSQLPPGRGSDTELGREVHSFSRLFSASFYDCVESVYKQAVSEGQSPEQALITSEQVNGPLLLRAIEAGSSSRATFKEVALGMLAADKAQNGGKYSKGLTDGFVKRKILTAGDVKADDARRAEVPAIQLPAGLNKANAVNFLEANAETLGLPADLPFTPDAVTTNGRGETFVSYRYSQEVPVTVAGLQDKVTDVQGGVNLVFDASGKLVDRVHTEIDAATVDREMAGIASLQEKNAIVNKESLELFKSSGADTSVFKSAIDGNKIVRIPISGCDHKHDH